MKAEGDVVASTKEAEQAGQHLIKERETLAEKIQKLKVLFKRMITHLEMEETSIKQTAFQKPLGMKNDQISECQALSLQSPSSSTRPLRLWLQLQEEPVR